MELDVAARAERFGHGASISPADRVAVRAGVDATSPGRGVTSGGATETTYATAGRSGRILEPRPATPQGGTTMDTATATVLRAWKDEPFRNGLTEEQRAAIPPKPENFEQLTDDQLENAAGGATPALTIGMTLAYAGGWVANEIITG